MADHSGNKRKVSSDDMANTKLARTGDTQRILESTVAVCAMCNCNNIDRMSANPDNDRLVAIAMVHKNTDPSSAASLEGASHTVFFYDQGQPVVSAAALAAGTSFKRCDNEADMIAKFKETFDSLDASVVVGFQVQLFDLWYIVSRGARLGVAGIANLGRGGVPVHLDSTAPLNVVAGAGGASSYPVKTKASDRATSGALPTAAHLPAHILEAGPPTFNRRVEIPGRRVDDVWELVQGRFTLKAYDLRTLTGNFITKEGQPGTPVFERTLPDMVQRIPAIAVSHAAALFQIRGVIWSLPAMIAFCFRCKEAGHNAKQCKVGLVCKSCGEAGHKVTHCPKALCKVCGRTGHLASVCYKVATCNHCQQLGHTSQFCRQKLMCEACGSIGHTEERCFTKHPCQHCGGRHPSDRCYKVHNCKICGKSGHMENRCYQNPDAQQNEQQQQQQQQQQGQMHMQVGNAGPYGMGHMAGQGGAGGHRGGGAPNAQQQMQELQQVYFQLQQQQQQQQQQELMMAQGRQGGGGGHQGGARQAQQNQGYGGGQQQAGGYGGAAPTGGFRAQGQGQFGAATPNPAVVAAAAAAVNSHLQPHFQPRLGGANGGAAGGAGYGAPNGGQARWY